MARVKRGVTAHQPPQAPSQRGRGPQGDPHRGSIKPAHEALLHALAYATRDRKQRKRQMRQLWIIRINAAARANGLTYAQLHRAASRRPRSSSTARSWPTSPCATPPRSAGSSRSPAAPDGAAGTGPTARSRAGPSRRRRREGSRFPAPEWRSRADRGPRDADQPAPRAPRRGPAADRRRRRTSRRSRSSTSHYLGRKGGALSGLMRGIGALPAEDRPRVGAVVNEVREAVEGALGRRAEPARRRGPRGAPGRGGASTSRARPAGRPRHAPPDHRDDRRGSREVFGQFGFVDLRGARGRERRHELPDAQHPARPPGPGPVGHAVRGHRRGACCGPTPRPARSGSCRRSGRRSGPSCRAAASATRRSTRRTPPSSSRSRGSWSTRGPPWPTCKGLLDEFAHAMFGPGRATRFRPGYYPFTEPSVAFDVGAWSAAARAARPARGRAG